MSADHVFLQTFEGVYAAPYGSLAEHFRGLLERCGGDEAVCLQCRTCDSLEHLAGCSRLGLAQYHHLQSLTLE